MRVFILAAMAATFAGTAMAQETPLTKVYACADIATADERLACFDAAVAGLKQSEASGGVSVVSREQVAEAEKQAFGLRGEAGDAVRASAAGTVAAEPPKVDDLAVTVATAVKKADGKYRFTLGNGQVWDQITIERVSGLNRLPAKAEISTGMLGSFMLRIDGGRSIRVKRVK